MCVKHCQTHCYAVQLSSLNTKLLAAKKVVLKDTRSNPGRPGKVTHSFILLQATPIWGTVFSNNFQITLQVTGILVKQLS